MDIVDSLMAEIIVLLEAHEDNVIRVGNEGLDTTRQPLLATIRAAIAVATKM